MYEGLRVAAVIPARDEAGAVPGVVAAVRELSRDGRPVVDRVVVCDNGSRDGTADRAAEAGAEVVPEPAPGYGAACQAALRALHDDPAEVVLFVDGDGSAAPADAVHLLTAIARGADLAVGARRRPGPGTMTVSQRAGTGFACWLIRRLWRTPVTDLGPFRAIRRGALERIGMTDRGCGWTVEMQVRAIQEGLAMAEVPVTVRPRSAGRSKISGRILGVARAGYGLLGTIARLRWRQHRHARAV